MRASETFYIFPTRIQLAFGCLPDGCVTAAVDAVDALDAVDAVDAVDGSDESD